MYVYDIAQFHPLTREVTDQGVQLMISVVPHLHSLVLWNQLCVFVH